MKVSELVDISQEEFHLKTGFTIPQYFISEMSEAFHEFDRVSQMEPQIFHSCNKLLSYRMGVDVFPLKRWRHCSELWDTTLL